MKKELKALVEKIDPGSNYVLVVNAHQVTQEDAFSLLGYLKEMGSEAVVVMSQGAPEDAAKFYEIPKERG